MSARRKPAQPSLFDVHEPPPAPRAPDLDFIRKHLWRVLRLMRNARSMPFTDIEMAKWERFFPDLTPMLPADEGRELQAEFDAELERLRSAA